MVKNPHSALTMIEMLVIIALICILGCLLLTVINRHNRRARLTACADHQRTIGKNIIYYSADNAGEIPDNGEDSDYRSTVLLRRMDNSPVALGKLLPGYVKTVEVFGCPDSPGYDLYCVKKNFQTRSEVRSAYLYRARSNAFAGQLTAPENQNRAILMDFACISCHGSAIAPHQYRYSNLLYSDGHVESRRNSRIPFQQYTAESAGQAGSIPGCSQLWQHADAMD